MKKITETQNFREHLNNLNSFIYDSTCIITLLFLNYVFYFGAFHDLLLILTVLSLDTHVGKSSK